MMTATATFDVTTFAPSPYEEPSVGPALARVVIVKTFSGDLVGTSAGEGLFCGLDTPEAGAGYVVSERVTGRLRGLEGTFVLQHGGVMGPGVAPRTFGHVVPGSGTGALQGLTGTVVIDRSAAGAHTLALTYSVSIED